MLNRCLSAEDLAFAAESGSAAVLNLFVDERRRLALEWMKEAGRETADYLQRAPLEAAERRRATEVQLLTSFALFVLVYQLWAAMVQLYGLLRAKAFGRCVRLLARILSELGGRVSCQLTPAAPHEQGSRRYGSGE